LEEAEGWLGVTEDAAAHAKGAPIERVLPGSPAAEAGLQPGDVIIRLGEAEIDSFSSLQREARLLEPQESVDLQVQRGQVVYQLRLRVGQRPDKAP
jgi:serine protease Do